MSTVFTYHHREHPVIASRHRGSNSPDVTHIRALSHTKTQTRRRHRHARQIPEQRAAIVCPNVTVEKPLPPGMTNDQNPAGLATPGRVTGKVVERVSVEGRVFCVRSGVGAGPGKVWLCGCVRARKGLTYWQLAGTEKSTHTHTHTYAHTHA